MASKLKKIQNVIMFISSTKFVDIHTAEEIKKIKKSDWTYLDYCVLACEENGYNLYILSKNDVRYSFQNNILNIDDKTTKTTFSLNETNTENTIIFQGQTNNDLSVVYIALFKLLYKLGFYIINPINAIINASDKYLSSVILSKFNIPQPNYIIIGKNDIEDENGIVNDDFYKKLHSIYSAHPNINDNHSNYKYVCKILNGSLGIGVFLCQEDEILSILQALITLNPKIYILIQEFKKNTGDIRAHAFSFDGNNYEIIASMKRNKIDGDFRSNVSLGATTEQIDLSAEQEKIILDTAKVSGCKWVGVDLMECKNIYDETENVVIEYNSSPGVNGISEQIKKNMFLVVFEKINEHLKNDVDVSANDKLEDNSDKDGQMATNGIDSNKIDDKKKTNENLEENPIVEKKESEKSSYPFDNIILFGDAESSADKILNDLCKASNVNLYQFNTQSIRYENNKLNNIVINNDKISSKNTVIFSRIKYEDINKYEKLFKELSKDKYLIINNIDGVNNASDKIKSAELFKKHKIQQPSYVELEAKDVEVNLDTKGNTNIKLFKKLKDIYSDAETNKERKYVVKNPVGKQGIGVFVVDGNQILSVLQAYFDVAKDKKLIVQEFLDADGGDFRIHVLTLKTGQHLLYGIKRNQVKNDFRSNIALGATHTTLSESDFTPEQKELALKAAKAVDLTWAGVDIMPVKNNKIKNVVIECNANPGAPTTADNNVYKMILDKITKEDLG